MTLKSYELSIVAAPLAAGPTPNATPPAAARIWTARYSGLQLALIDGTSATVQVWVRYAEWTVWATLHAAIAMTPATVPAPVVVPTNAQIFVQVTAAAGAPTTIGADFLPIDAGSSSADAVLTALAPAAIATPAAVTGTASAVALASAVATKGVYVQADSTNTTNLRVGDSAVTTTRGVQLVPGAGVFLEVDNASRVYLIAESGSPKANVAIL